MVNINNRETKFFFFLVEHLQIDGPFQQQKLPAWQPVMIPRTVLPTLFIVGILFCPIGGLLYWSNNKVPRLNEEYKD